MHAVVRYMQQHGREKETAAWLAHEYGGKEGNNLFIVRAGSPETAELTWPKVQRRIAQLIKADKFYTEAERDCAYLPDPGEVHDGPPKRTHSIGDLIQRNRTSKEKRDRCDPQWKTIGAILTKEQFFVTI